MNVAFSAAIWTSAVLALAAVVFTVWLIVANHGRYVVLHVRRSELSLIPEQVAQARHLTRLRWWMEASAILAIVIALTASVLYSWVTLFGQPAVR